MTDFEKQWSKTAGWQLPLLEGSDLVMTKNAKSDSLARALSRRITQLRHDANRASIAKREAHSVLFEAHG